VKMQSVDPKPVKASRRVLKRSQVEVFFRDLWLCRYCGKPVIFAPALKYLQREIDPPWPCHQGLAYWRYAYDRNGAPLLDELAAGIDHVRRFSGGGPGEPSNLATACNKCNTKKNNSDPVRWVKEHPLVQIKAKYGEPTILRWLERRFLLSGLGIFRRTRCIRERLL